jgi:hypothetical protein
LVRERVLEGGYSSSNNNSIYYSNTWWNIRIHTLCFSIYHH